MRVIVLIFIADLHKNAMGSSFSQHLPPPNSKYSVVERGDYNCGREGLIADLTSQCPHGETLRWESQHDPRYWQNI
jgi:hypothetical protein